MRFEGRRDKYAVTWFQVGYSYAQARIYKKRKFWFKKILWESSGPDPYPMLLTTVEKMHPQEMFSWFKAVVKEYEDYVDAWENE